MDSEYSKYKCISATWKFLQNVRPDNYKGRFSHQGAHIILSIVLETRLIRLPLSSALKILFNRLHLPVSLQAGGKPVNKYI